MMKKQINFWVSKELFDRIDGAAKTAGMTKSQVIRNCILSCLGEIVVVRCGGESTLNTDPIGVVVSGSIENG